MVRGPQRVTVEEAFAPLLRQRFDLFLEFVVRELNGGRKFVPGWHLDAVEHQLHRMHAGELTDLIVTLPPRHLKSITISVAWVAWMLGREPATRFIAASYDYKLAKKHARDCLKVIESNWYRKVFPNMRLTKRSVGDFETYAGGGRLTTSVGGGITGRGGDWVIVDDPMDGGDALSEVVREKTQKWFAETLHQRGDDDRTKFIIVMQRLHEDDLAGFLLRKGGWHELRLSAIATEDERVPLTRGRFHQRRAGCVLAPGSRSKTWLERKRAAEPYVFASQYQQDPVGRIGAFVMPEWFGTYDDPPTSGPITISMDTAFKTTVRSDWSVAIVSRWYGGRHYILDVWRARVEFGDLLAKTQELIAQHRPDRLLIEDAASGQSLIQQLSDLCSQTGVMPTRIKPNEDKILRFELQANKIKAGQLVLPRTGPWILDFVNETTRFPGVRHDDQADALAHLLANPPVQLPRNAAPILVDASDPWLRNDYDPYDDPWAGR